MHLSPVSSPPLASPSVAKPSSTPSARLRGLLAPTAKSPLDFGGKSGASSLLGLYDRGGQVGAPFGETKVKLAVDAFAESTREEATALTLKTRDGDEVTITFVRDAWQRESASTRQSADTSEAAASGAERTAAQSTTSLAGATFLSQLDSLKDGVANQTITFAASESRRETGSYLHSGANGTAVYEYSQERGAAVGFSFSVEGELDADELEAIGQLVQQVDGIATSFFEGNVYDALAQGKSLGYDENEIATFALKLEKTETQTVAARYEEQQRRSEPRAALPSPLARRVARHLEDLKTAEKLAERLLSKDSFVTLLTSLTDRLENRFSSRRGLFPGGPGALHARLSGVGPHLPGSNRRG